MVAVGADVLAADINLLLFKPMVRLVQQSSQSLTNGVGAAITFGSGSEEFDIPAPGIHDTTTNTSRITPQIAGYYSLKGTVNVASSAALTILVAYLVFNGSTIQPFNRTKPAATATTCSAQVMGSALFNGTTDYIELFGNQTSGGALSTQASGGVNSTFELSFERLP